jgi:hypothetical protein
VEELGVETALESLTTFLSMIERPVLEEDDAVKRRSSGWLACAPARPRALGRALGAAAGGQAPTGRCREGERPGAAEKLRRVRAWVRARSTADSMDSCDI